MAEVYSDWFVGSGANTALPAVPNIQPSGRGHNRMRYSQAVFTIAAAQDLADNDVIRMLPLKSGDRPLHIYVSAEAGFGTTTPVNLGLYKAGKNHDGAVVTAGAEDLFMSAVDIDAGRARTDDWNEAAHFADEDRGKALWELVNLETASTYDNDPLEIWELCFTFSGNPAAAAAEARLMTEVVYIAGD